ncbi:hypothetical protein GCM10028777_19940 [Angustibacter speluncae]
MPVSPAREPSDPPPGSRVAGLRPLRQRRVPVLPGTAVPELRPVPTDARSGEDSSDSLAAARSLLATTLESITDGLLVVDGRGRVVGRNRAFDDMWGMPPELQHAPHDSVLIEYALTRVVDPAGFVSRVEAVYSQPELVTQDEVHLLDGRVMERYSAPQRTDGRVVGRVWRFRDVTADRRLRADLERQAFTDQLTGLPNRARFMSDLQRALDTWLEQRGRLAVCLLDLDGFKFVNDALGHRAGDRLLQVVSGRLASLVPRGATVARLGGDEFGVVLPGRAAGDVAALCQLAVDAMSRPVELFEGPVKVGASAGWASLGPDSPADRVDAERLLHQADVAMYRAKETGRGRVVAWSEDMRREDPHAGREEVEALLADHSGIVVVYQPICDLRTGRAVGFEALSRFPGREHRTVPEWFAVARRVGLGDELEARAVDLALQQSLEPDQYLTVNLSPRALRADVVRAVLDRDLTGVVVEVTEESDLATDAMVAATDWLRTRGARIAMDDTGEGFAGLRRLVHLRPDLVKLDRTLVSDVHQHPDKAALVEALVAFCRRTGAELCAEGVETVEELWALRDLHVTFCQGWLAGRPSPLPAPPHHSFVAACHGVRTVRGDVGPALRLLEAATSRYDLRQALDESIVALDVDGVAWSDVRGDVLVAVHSLDDVPAGTYRIADYPATQVALTTGRIIPVDVDDALADPQEVRLLLEVGYHGVLLVPVPGPDGGSASLLELYSRQRRTWHDDDLGLVRSLAAALAHAVAVGPAH